MKQGYKECPYCANEIKEGALKCQYCGEFLNKQDGKIKTKYKSTSMPLYVKIIIGAIIFIFGIILISHNSNSSSVVSYNDSIIDNVSACYNSFDNIPDNLLDFSYNDLHQIVIDGISTCKTSKSNIISLGGWKGNFKFKTAAENFTDLAISFFNEYDDYILYLYPDKGKNRSNLEKDTESLRSLGEDVDNAWGVLVNVQKDFSKEYDYELEY